MAYLLGTYPRRIDDWLHHESDRDLYRETVTIMAGAGNCDTGLLLGKTTVGGKYGPYDLTATDGRQTPRAFLLLPVDATDEANDRKGVVVTGHAAIKRAYVLWHESITSEAQKDTAFEQLKAHHFFSRDIA